MHIWQIIPINYSKQNFIHQNHINQKIYGFVKNAIKHFYFKIIAIIVIPYIVNMIMEHNITIEKNGFNVIIALNGIIFNVKKKEENMKILKI